MAAARDLPRGLDDAAQAMAIAECEDKEARRGAEKRLAIPGDNQTLIPEQDECSHTPGAWSRRL